MLGEACEFVRDPWRDARRISGMTTVGHSLMGLSLAALAMP